MQVSTKFGQHRLIFFWSILRLTNEGHLELSDFLQNWLAIVYWDPQQVYQVWSQSGKNWNFFTCNFGEGAVRPAAPSEGRSVAAGASRSPPSPLPPLSSRAHRGQKHGSYTVSNCHNVFSIGVILMKFGTHWPWRDACVSLFISNSLNLANNGHFANVDQSLRRKALITHIQFLCGLQIHTAFVGRITSSLRGQWYMTCDMIYDVMYGMI